MSTPANFNPYSTNPMPDFGPPRKNDNSGKIITGMGIALALLLGSNIWLLLSKNKTSNELQSVSMELTEQQQAFVDLEVEFKEAQRQLEEQKGITAELDAKINEQLQELQSKKGEIATLIRERKNYKSALADFTTQKNGYLAEISALKEQMGVLTAENTSLKTSLTDTRTRLDETAAAKATLMSEKTQIESERNTLSKKVDVGSAVKVHNITVKPIDIRRSGKEKEKAKAKNVDRLNICFQTEANEVTAPGQETFYLAILDPQGATLAVEDLGSGISKEKKSNTDFRFTVAESVYYGNEPIDVCATWQPGQNFAKGNYKVQVYNKGYMVGSGSFNLK